MLSECGTSHLQHCALLRHKELLYAAQTKAIQRLGRLGIRRHPQATPWDWPCDTAVAWLEREHRGNRRCIRFWHVRSLGLGHGKERF